MRIAVVGLGGVGGYIAANLAKSSHEVIGFARGEHLRMIQKEGLTIYEDTQKWHVDLKAFTLEEAKGYFDIVFFCVKSYDLEKVYAQIAHTIDEKTILLSLSNGVNNGDVLRELSDSVILDGCVYILSHVQKPATIRKKGDVFALVFGGEEHACKVLAEVIEESSLRYKIPHNIKSAIWKKYIFISAFATLTSYYDKSIGYVSEHHNAEARKLLKEVAEVAKTKNINLEEEVEKSMQTASNIPYDSSTSMRLDFFSKKQTEIESLSGYIVREGEVRGVQTPLMKKMYNSLKKRV